jgi:hypothetical protein
LFLGVDPLYSSISLRQQILPKAKALPLVMDLEIATASDRHSAKATDSASDIALVEATGSNNEYNSLNETGPVYLSGWHFWLMSAAYVEAQSTTVERFPWY